MKKIIKLICLFVLGAYLPSYAQVQLNIDATNVSHTVHPMIQGQGLVYSEEADSIYADGSMAQLFQDVGAGFLRWPGGTVTTMSHWNDLTGVGWVDKWNPAYDPSGDRDPSEYMDLDEYMTLTNAAGTEPMLGINMSSGLEWDREEEALQEAKDMIQYCIDNNFNVKYFYLDNETYHHGNGYNKDADGDGGGWTPELYAEQINIYAPAIKALVPDAILIANWTDKVRTNTNGYTVLINNAGHNIDYIDVHWYWKWGVATWDTWKETTPMQNDTEWYDGGTFVEEIEFFNDLTASLGKPHIKIAALEWNIAPGDYNVNPDHTQFKHTLMQSEMQMQFMQAGLELGAMWTTQWKGSSTAEFQQLINSDDNYAPSPSVKMFELYKHAIGGNVVSSTISDNQMMTTTVVKGDMVYAYILSKDDVTNNVEFVFNGVEVLSVETAQRFNDPGVLTDIGLWPSGVTGNYLVNVPANTLTMVAFKRSLPENLIVNGDCEDGLNNWDLWNNPTITTDVQEGSAAVKMFDKGSVSQWVSVEPLTTYTFSAYAKTSDSAKKISLGVADGDNLNIVTADVYDTAYKLQQLTFTTDANTTSVRVWAWQPPSDGASAFVDNMKLKKGGPALNFSVTGLTPVQSSDVNVRSEATKLPTDGALTFTISEAIDLSDAEHFDVYINKELANDACTWSLNSANTLALNHNTAWPEGALISVMIDSEVCSDDRTEYEFIVDTDKDYGYEKLTISPMVTRNGGTHNIPLIVSLPTDRTNKVPVQFWVHGGGWNGGTATDSYTWNSPHSIYLAEELGIATLQIAYRCVGSDGTFTLAMEDLDAAYQWAVDNAELYNLDLTNAFFAGGSAGTPLSSLAAQRYEDIKAYVGFNGVFNFVDNPNSTFPPSDTYYSHNVPSQSVNSAFHNLRANPPATLLLHGDNDVTINYTQSTLFADAIVQAGGTAEAIIYPGEEHAFFNKGYVQFEDCLYEMTKFLKANGIMQTTVTTEVVTEVLNGDFENGMNNWNSWNNPTNTTDAYEGSSAVKFVDKGSFDQWVDVEPNTTYTLSAFVKTSDSAKRVVMGIQEDGVNVVNIDVYDTEYTLQQKMFTTGANTSAVKVWAWQPPSDGASAFVDYITLKKTAYALNADFEKGLTAWSYYGGTSTETSSPISGGTSLTINSNGGASQWIKTKSATTYEISFTAKIADITHPVRFHVKDAGGTKYFEQSIYDTQATDYTITFTTNAGEEDSKVGFWRPKGAVGGAWLDNVTILEVSSGARFGITEVEQPQAFNLEVFPNPASDFVTISSNQANGIKSLVLYNIVGQPVLSQTFRAEHKLSVADLNKGTYILVVTDQSGNRKTSKLFVD